MLGWLLGRKNRNETQIASITNGPGTYSVDVVGESNYQSALEEICGGHTEQGHRYEIEANLVLEDDNPHDSNAVMVSIEGETVGYLDRSTARSFRIALKAVAPRGAIAKCPAIIVGGWDRGGGDRGHFGVKLDLPIA